MVWLVWQCHKPDACKGVLWIKPCGSRARSDLFCRKKKPYDRCQWTLSRLLYKPGTFSYVCPELKITWHRCRHRQKVTDIDNIIVALQRLWGLSQTLDVTLGLSAEVIGHKSKKAGRLFWIATRAFAHSITHLVVWWRGFDNANTVSALCRSTWHECCLF